MEEDIENYSPTVMFRGTPCIFPSYQRFLLTASGNCPIGQFTKTTLKKKFSIVSSSFINFTTVLMTFFVLIFLNNKQWPTLNTFRQFVT